MITLVPADPASSQELGAVVALHGAGSTAAVLADQIAMAMTAAGITGFAVICVDGGGTYWHRRANGDDPIGMIIHEVLPRAAAAGISTGRIGITGESMGGYGALLLAQRMSVHSVAAVAALSPAIFGSYVAARSVNAGAFDSEQDFANNDVFAGISALRHVPTWVACGVDDPFQPEAALFRAGLAQLTGQLVPGGILEGCHDEAFWLRYFPAALRFIGGHLG